MNELLILQKNVKNLLSKFQVEIEKAKFKNDKLISNFNISFDEENETLNISCSFSSFYYKKINKEFKFFINPIRNKLIKSLRKALPKEYKIKNNDFYIIFSSYVPFDRQKIPYVCLIYNRLKTSVDNYLISVDEINDFSEIILKYNFKKDQEKIIDSVEFNLKITNIKVKNKNFIADIEFINKFEFFMNEIVSSFVDFFQNSIKDLISRKKGIIQLLLFCQNNKIALWSLMIDGHFKIKEIKKPIYSEEDHNKCKLHFSFFKKNYFNFVDKFIKLKKQKDNLNQDNISDYILNEIKEEENNINQTYIKNIKEIFFNEIEKTKQCYCIQKNNQKKEKNTFLGKIKKFLRF